MILNAFLSVFWTFVYILWRNVHPNPKCFLCPLKFEKCLPGEVSDHSHSGPQLKDCSLPDPGAHWAVYGPAAMASPGTVRHGDSQTPVIWLNQNLTISPLKLHLILPPWQCSETFFIVASEEEEGSPGS